ncbi:restriction endonuclease subunit S [Bradyrhizobium sp. 138]|uniref:restriction endonuclease subunit S n=1 Tax=Bradyrhizobium sp. 138 TaxID=2782615 RepID=UPI001FFA5AFC|nr:restriction endonuclease subunit S [Bradyrhizobium sp. 138]MCK1733968.1 restriction endonuclease subunit S [Bradyrhizobium sp. 138]
MTTLPLKALTESLFMGVNASRLSKDPIDIEPVPIIHIKDVVDNVVADVGRLETIELPTPPQNSRQRLLPGDILLSARGTLMKCAVIPSSHFATVASANFIVIRLGTDAVLQPELLWVFLRQPSTQARLLSGVTGTAQPALNIRAIEELVIPIPPREIQSDLVRLTLLAEQQYRCALEGAKLRQEEAMEIVAQYMDS